jgi:hypothetical protein
MSNEGQKLIATLVTAMHSETMRVTEICAKDREDAAFVAGYQAGKAEGQRIQLQEIQATLGIPHDWQGEKWATEALKEWHEREPEDL